MASLDIRARRSASSRYEATYSSSLIGIESKRSRWMRSKTSASMRGKTASKSRSTLTRGEA